MKMENNDGDYCQGLQTSEALQKLYNELWSEVQQHHSLVKNEPLSSRLKKSALSYNNVESVFHWTSCLILLISALALLIGYSVQPLKNNWLVVESLILLLLMVFNIYAILWDYKLSCNETTQKIKSVLSKLQECIKEKLWDSSNYIDLNAPLSPCVSLQWTYRDGEMVNVPINLLVEGDHVCLRPGQIVPAKCKTISIDPGTEEDIRVFEAGTVFSPSTEEDESTSCYGPSMRSPLKVGHFVLLETPYLHNIRMLLNERNSRPPSMLNNERFTVYTTYIERRFVPIVLILMIVISGARYFTIGDFTGHWAEMFFVLPFHAVFPLLPILTPLLWKLLDYFGVAWIIATYYCGHGAEPNCGDGFESHSTLDLSTNTSFVKMLKHFRFILRGTSGCLPRTSNILHALGNLTSFCCIDKKGILSWPNPSAEKVFFLRNPELLREGGSQGTHEGTTTPEGPESDESEHSQRDYPSACNFEVLDLTQDPKSGFYLNFDDPEWKKYMTSLKPLGLNILLNTCNMETADKYSEFADHVTFISQKQEGAVPVVNRRCFCELARQIGFSEQAMDIFELQQILGLYRQLGNEGAGLSFQSKSFIKYKMPMPNVFSVIVKENNSGNFQLFSQGTADLLLDACSEYWDGNDLCTLNIAERKKILDFYHRTSMSSYCTSFSYRPLTQEVGDEFTDIFIEIPENNHNGLFTPVSPTPSRSWDVKSLDSRLKKHYHASCDSLMYGNSISSVHEVEDCFRVQCNQIFIGMITMQYQAKQDIVQLIEDLESACIRFVHFSKENELRSRVFSEKMGLEAGWNCHISLLSEAPAVDTSRGSHSCQDVSHTDANKRKNNVFDVDGSGAGQLQRSESAPSTLNIDMVQVKFEPTKTVIDESRQRHSHSPVHVAITNDDKSDVDGVTSATPLLETTTKRAARRSSEIHNSHHDLRSSRALDHDPLSSIESYPASSYITENTDSVTGGIGGLGFSNRAKLPKGIENIRPHIANVDNVPLLVSLFTDCTPSTTREMLSILQENGEVLCCLGSSANINNTGQFLQADCSMAVDPMFSQICMKQPAINKPWVDSHPTPMELSAMLHSIPCALHFNRDDKVNFLHLVAIARHYCQSMRNTFIFYLMLQLTVVILQVIAAIFVLPPILSPKHILWVAVVVVPCFSLVMMFNKPDPGIVAIAQGKNKEHIRKQSVAEFVMYYSIRFCLVIAICMITHILTLHNICHKMVRQYNNTCHYMFGDTEHGSVGEWNGWYTEFSSGLALSQNIALLILVMAFACCTLCFVHRLQHLWQKSPFSNKIMCIVVPVILVLQLLYTVFDMSIENSHLVVKSGVSEVPIAVWVLLVVTPLLIIPVNELVKRREIKLSVRYQKRARLDFGTKLGMNSPF